MGKWTLEGITARSDTLDDGGLFGTNFRVKLRLAYASSLFTPFESSPVLDWREKFTTLEHHAGNYWTFESNMFRHKPGSPTFDAWSKRYIAAYAFVTRGSSPLTKGTVEFYDKKGRPVSPKEFEKKSPETDLEKANVVKEYLGKHGGVFEIEVHDVPSIGTSSPNRHVERLLLFDCGLEGLEHQRVKAMQYLNVDTNQPQNTWQREFSISPPFTRNDLPTQGLALVQPPPNVSLPNEILMAGESL